MSAGGAFGGNRGVRPVPPEKGVFPLDHMHLCDLEKKEYINCLKSSGHKSEKCRHLSKLYLQCRMEKNLMAKQDMSELGFGRECEAESLHDGSKKGGTIDKLGARCPSICDIDLVRNWVKITFREISWILFDTIILGSLHTFHDKVSAVGHAAIFAAIKEYMPCLIPSPYTSERLGLVKQLKRIKKMEFPKRSSIQDSSSSF